MIQNQRAVQEPAQDIEDVYALAPMQQGMVFQYLFAPQSGVNIAQLVGKLDESIDVPALTQAFQSVVDQHPMLRTSFVWKGLAEPVQRVHRRAIVPVVAEDWRGLGPEAQEIRLQDFLRRDREQGFDLTRPPLMRVAVFQIADQASWMVWNVHHTIVDGRTVYLVLKQVFAAYEAICEDRPLPQEASRRYRDYIEWLPQQDLAAGEVFWRSLLKDLTPPKPFPRIPSASKAAQPNVYALYQATLDPERTAALKATASEHGLTLSTLVNGAWALALRAYSGHDDVVFGITRHGRPKETLPGADTMIGIFINTLPMRVRITPDLPLAAWLARLRAEQAEARRYEYCPLFEIRRWSGLPGRGPLFESIVVFDNLSFGTSLRRLGGSWEGRRFYAVERFDDPLVLNIHGEESLSVEASYDTRRLDQPAVRRMVDTLLSTLIAMIDNMDRPVAHVIDR
ncbi:MAG TPA: condensation domain-containing protein [Herpetosiphonaceae bacterium]